MFRAMLSSLAILCLVSPAMSTSLPCGRASYDPTQYICYNNNFLCPVISGEPLSYCAGACYSKFMYACTANVLAPLRATTKPFTLTISNPTLAIHNQPLSASGGHLVIGGATASFCPGQVVPRCPAGNITALAASGGSAGMAVEVPGGQQVFLDKDARISFTQAHSGDMGTGSVATGFVAYVGGGFVNLNGNGMGWAACPPTAMGGGGGQWGLVAKTAANVAGLGNCYGVNLKVHELPAGTVAAWEYT